MLVVREGDRRLLLLRAGLDQRVIVLLARFRAWGFLQDSLLGCFLGLSARWRAKVLLRVTVDLLFGLLLLLVRRAIIFEL